MSSIIKQMIIVYFSHSLHFMNGAGVCWIIRRTVFNVYICCTCVQLFLMFTCDFNVNVFFGSALPLAFAKYIL